MRTSTETPLQPTKAHATDLQAGQFGQAVYRMFAGNVPDGAGGRKEEPDLYRTCSYCGSLHVETVLQAMVRRGTEYSGADWKYGWPHKFYIDIQCEPYHSWAGSDGEKDLFADRTTRNHKFYADHLLDASPDELLLLWNRVVAPLVGVRYIVDGEKLKYSAVCNGFQTWGVVGGLGAVPVGRAISADAPIVPAWFIDEE